MLIQAPCSVLLKIFFGKFSTAASTPLVQEVNRYSWLVTQE